MAKADGQFKPGTSGNPGGRPKNHGKIKDLAREVAGEAIYGLVRQIDDRRIAPRERRAAAKLLLRIGFGPANASGTHIIHVLGWSQVADRLREAAERHAAVEGSTARA